VLKIIVSSLTPHRIFERFNFVIARIAQKSPDLFRSMTMVYCQRPRIFPVSRLRATNSASPVLAFIYCHPLIWRQPVLFQHFFESVFAIVLPRPLSMKVRALLSVGPLGLPKLFSMFTPIPLRVFSFFLRVISRPPLSILCPFVPHANSVP